MNIGSSIACILVSSFGFYNLGSTLGALKVHHHQQLQQQQNHHQQQHESSTTSSLLLNRRRINSSSDIDEPISSPTNNILPSSFILRLPQSSQRLQQPRSTSLPIWKDTDESSTSTTSEYQQQQLLLREQQEESIKRNELLVHPAMLVHENSEIVVVISTSTTTSNNTPDNNLKNELRKHKTLERTYMVDSHNKEELILKKLLKKYNKNGDGIDVVLIEEEDDNGSDSSSSSLAFAEQWHQVLEPNDGVLAIRLNSYTDLASRVQELEDAGFNRIIDYSVRRARRQSRKTHSDSDYYLLAFSTDEGIAEWHTNEATWNLKLHTRLKDPSQLHFVDSATMIQLEYPSKRSALLHCPQSEDVTSIEECTQYSSGFNITSQDFPLDFFEVAKSGVGENAGRGVFATRDIPAHSYLNLKGAVHPVKANWKATSIINGLLESNKYYSQIESLFSYLDGYGYVDETWGEEQYSVESDLMLFVNHGCNGTMNLGWESSFSEQTMDLAAVKANREKYWFDDYDVTYDPMSERTMGSSASIGASNFKELKAGDELLENYMAFFAFDDIEESYLQLRNECNGGAGYVEQYQDSSGGGVIKKGYVFTAIDLDDSSNGVVNRVEELDNQTQDHRRQ